jgi:hypothetical protein
LITGLVGKQKLTLCLETGAQVSVITEGAVDKYKVPTKPLQRPIGLKSYQGSKSTEVIKQEVTFEINFIPGVLRCTFLVSPSQSQQILLGNDSLLDDQIEHSLTTKTQTYNLNGFFL